MLVAAMKVAQSDARAIGRKDCKAFQPGVTTPEEILGQEEDLLREWVHSDQFEEWCDHLKRNVDVTRSDLERLLNA